MKKLFLLLLMLSCLVTAKSQVTRNMVFEELTGTWCQYCPRGTWLGDSLMEKYNNVIFISVHVSDPMELAGYPDSTELTGAPTANIDRIKKALGTDVWFEGYGVRNGENTYASVAVTPTYNPTTRELSVKLTGDFKKVYSGDYRFAAIVVEDGVVGDNTSYNQTNYYAGSSKYYGGFEKLPSSIPYYMIAYDHVPRQLLGGYYGQYGSLPGSISKNSQHEYTFNWTVPAGYRANYMKVVGLIVNAKTNEIINAGVSKYLEGATNAKPFFVNEPNTEGWADVTYSQTVTAHDPDDAELIITAQNLPSWLKMKDLGHNRVKLEGTPTQAGDVSFKLTALDAALNETAMTVTLHIGPAFPHKWEIISGSPVTTAKARHADMAVAPDNTIYVAYVDYASNIIYVKKYQNGTWSMVGPPIGGVNYEVSIGVDNNGVPHVAYNTINQKMEIVGLVMKKFDGSKWVQVADVIQQGVNQFPDVVFDHNNNPYVAYTQGNTNTAIYCFLAAIDVGYWLNLGFLVQQNGIYPKCVFNSKDVPYVIWADYYDSLEVHVSKYNKTSMEWKPLSTQPIGRTSSFLDLAIDKNDNLYCAFANDDDKTLDVFKWTGSKWSQIGNNILKSAVYGKVEIACDQQGNVYVLSLEQDWGNYVTVMKYDGSKWASVGPPRFSKGGAYYTELVIDKNNVPLASFTDEGYGSELMVESYGKYSSVNNVSPAMGDISLFPNPADQVVFVNLDGTIKDISLFDVTGRKVKQIQLNRQFDQQSFKIDLSGIESGTYVVKVNRDTGLETGILQIVR